MSMKLRELAVVAMITVCAPAALAIEEGDQAPDFTLPAMQEGAPDISLADLRGKTVYVDFWASWCAPCLRSMPLINELYGKYRDRDFEVVAINVDDPIEDGQDFLIDRDFDYLIAADTPNEVLTEYGVVGMPTSFLIDPEGTVRLVHTGFKANDIEIIEQEIVTLLDEVNPQ